MKKRKLTQILIETVETIIIRRSRKPREEQLIAWCEECGLETLMVSPEAAAELMGASLREIYRRVEAGALHSIETPEDPLFICPASLRSSTGRDATLRENEKASRDVP